MKSVRHLTNQYKMAKFVGSQAKGAISKYLIVWESLFKLFSTSNCIIFFRNNDF